MRVARISPRRTRLFSSMWTWIPPSGGCQREEERERYIDVELQHRLRQEYRGLAAGRNGVLVPSDRAEDETFRRVWGRWRMFWRKSGNRKPATAEEKENKGVRYA